MVKIAVYSSSLFGLSSGRQVAEMVHSKKAEKEWEESTIEPIAIVGMSKLMTRPKPKLNANRARLSPPRRN
jgi:hypothetical protein